MEGEMSGSLARKQQDCPNSWAVETDIIDHEAAVRSQERRARWAREREEAAKLEQTSIEAMKK